MSAIWFRDRELLLPILNIGTNSLKIHKHQRSGSRLPLGFRPAPTNAAVQDGRVAVFSPRPSVDALVLICNPHGRGKGLPPSSLAHSEYLRHLYLFKTPSGVVRYILLRSPARATTRPPC